MSIKLILATDKNGGLGKDNKLLFSIPQDMEWFKLQTMNMPVVMGRKTHQSIGRLLPGRDNIILTRDPDFKVEGAMVVNEILPILRAAEERDIMIIGGEEVYHLFLPHADTIYHTRIEAEAEADTHFTIDFEAWENTYRYRPDVADIHPKIEFQIWKRV